MAIRLADVYTNSLAASSDYPGGGFKNSTSAGGADGTPLDQAWANDFLGFFQALLQNAGITASGAPDTARSSQYLDAMKKVVLQAQNPPGSLYFNADDPTNPATLLGFGTWAPFGAGRMLLSAGAGYAAGSTGGESTHTLIASEMPAHTHVEKAGAADADWGQQPPWPTENNGYITASNDSRIKLAATVDTLNSTASTGGGQPHNNMPPYITVYVWRRVS